MVVLVERFGDLVVVGIVGRGTCVTGRQTDNMSISCVSSANCRSINNYNEHTRMNMYRIHSADKSRGV